MSVRDEMADTLAEIHEQVARGQRASLTWEDQAKALMPIVERVAKEASIQGINEGARSPVLIIEIVKGIVRRVCGE